MARREECVKNIIYWLGVLETTIRLENEQKFFDSNIVAEEIYAGLLNRIFGWNLTNMNDSFHNEAGVDLIDEENGIVIQVSSTSTAKKIQHTIDECEKSLRDFSKYHLLMLFLCGKQKSYKSTFKTEGIIQFDKKKDIWDNGRIIEHLKEITVPISVLEAVEAFLEEEVPRKNNRQNLTGVEYTDPRIDTSSIQYYYDDMMRIWEEVPEEESVIGRESFANAYIESSCMVDGERKTILSQLERIFCDGKKVILLHGQPGHGKTTFCRFAVYQFAKGQALQNYKNVFRFSLNPSHSQIITENKVIIKNAFCFDKNGDPVKFEACRDALIFLDGYDELKTQSYETNVKDIIAFEKELLSYATKYNIHFVITSRTNAVNECLKQCKTKLSDVLEFANLSEEEQKDWIYSEKRPEGEKEELRLYWENYLSKAYTTIGELTGIPIIFRMIVRKRYLGAIHANNRAKLYEDLFLLTIDKRVEDEEQKRLKKSAYENLAFDIFKYNEDTAIISNQDSEKRELLYFYYLSEKKDRDAGQIEIGFIHRSFYQYFLAEFFYQKLLRSTTEEKAERFLGCLGSRRLDEDIRKFFCEICDNHPENESAITNCANRVLKVLEKNSGMVRESISFDSMNYMTASRNPLERGNNIFVIAINLCIYLDVNQTLKESEELRYPLRTYQCSKIILSNHHKEGKDRKATSIDLSFADLQDAILRYADLSYANLQSSKMSFASLTYAQLCCADLSGAKLSSANLRYANLEKAKLSSANLNAAELISANLNDTELVSTKFTYANLRSASLKSARLQRANFHGAKLRVADLTGANISGVDFSGADLSGSNLKYADFSKISMKKTTAIVNLKEANLEKARISSYYYDGEKRVSTFPIDTIGYAKFDYIYVDDCRYTRQGFFDHFQPDSDHSNEDDQSPLFIDFLD